MMYIFTCHKVLWKNSMKNKSDFWWPKELLQTFKDFLWNNMASAIFTCAIHPSRGCSLFCIRPYSHTFHILDATYSHIHVYIHILNSALLHAHIKRSLRTLISMDMLPLICIDIICYYTPFTIFESSIWKYTIDL